MITKKDILTMIFPLTSEKIFYFVLALRLQARKHNMINDTEN